MHSRALRALCDALCDALLRWCSTWNTKGPDDNYALFFYNIFLFIFYGRCRLAVCMFVCASWSPWNDRWNDEHLSVLILRCEAECVVSLFALVCGGIVRWGIGTEGGGVNGPRLSAFCCCSWELEPRSTEWGAGRLRRVSAKCASANAPTLSPSHSVNESL